MSKALIPREVSKWFDKLDLTYAIRNLTRDLANGFVVAEILSRYFSAEVDIYQYYNGLKIEKRIDNWQRITKVLNKNGFACTNLDYEPVIYLKKNAALEFIKRLYEFLERRTLIEMPDPMEEKRKLVQPHYFKETATMLMKDTELDRIEEKKIQFNTKVSVLNEHYQKSKEDRKRLHLDEFILKQRKKLLEENARKLLEGRRKAASKQEVPQMQEPKTIELKNLDGNKNKNKEDNASIDSNILVEEINKLALGLLENNELMEEFRALADYALAPENRDDFFVDIMTKPDYLISMHTERHFKESLVYFVEVLFGTIAGKVPELQAQVFNYITDYKYLLNIFLRCLAFLVPDTPVYEAFLRMMTTFGRTLAEDKNSSSLLFIESVGLEYLVQFARLHSNKHDALAHILMSLCPSSDEARLRVYLRLERTLGPDLRTLSSLLAHLAAYQALEGFQGPVLDLFWAKAVVFLQAPSPKVQTRGLRILAQISATHFERMPGVYPTLRRLAGESWWEIKAQILLICAHQLELIRGGLESAPRERGLHSTQQHGEETVEGAIPHIDEGAAEGPEGEELEGSQEQKFEATLNSREADAPQNQNLTQGTQQSQLSQPGEYDSAVVHLLELVTRIFDVSSNINVKKIGLICLAKVLNYYEDLCDRYLEVLLSVDEDVRRVVLDIEPSNQGDYHVVLSNLT